MGFETMIAELADALNPARAFGIHSGRQWGGVSDPNRSGGNAHMKSQSCISCTTASLMIVLLFVCLCMNIAAQTNAEGTLKSKAPTGNYDSAIGIHTFFVRLETNGAYQVRVESRAPIRIQQQEGTWKWSAPRQEFLLTPMTNGEGFNDEFRRLRVDKQESDTLQWIPLQGVGASAGAIDYIRFKRRSN
jgi:hypothetical protein